VHNVGFIILIWNSSHMINVTALLLRILTCYPNIFLKVLFVREQVVAQFVETLFSDGITGIVHWHNSSGRTLNLGSAHNLTEISTRNISWMIEAAGI
jgi:hypothetical protein